MEEYGVGIDGEVLAVVVGLRLRRPHDPGDDGDWLIGGSHVLRLPLDANAVILENESPENR